MNCIVISKPPIQCIIILISIRIWEMMNIVHGRIVDSTRSCDEVTCVIIQYVDLWSDVLDSNEDLGLEDTVLRVCRDDGEVKCCELIREADPGCIRWVVSQPFRHPDYMVHSKVICEFITCVWIHKARVKVIHKVKSLVHNYFLVIWNGASS
jgi:hypothetical protein